MPKEIPILYATPMVQAIKEERKDTTRRMNGLDKVNEDPSSYRLRGLCIDLHGVLRASFTKDDGIDINDLSIKCPYGKPGDVLWVRESWDYFEFALDGVNSKYNEVGYEYAAGGEHLTVFTNYTNARKAWAYLEEYHKTGKSRWKPSIHMPKEAARIWLEVVSIRVERLQNISGKDAVAEGVVSRLPDNGIAQQQFADLWKAINGADSWYANPWVWVIQFKVLSTTGKPQSLITNH